MICVIVMDDKVIMKYNLQDTEVLMQQLEKDKEAVEQVQDIVEQEEVIMKKETQIVQDYADVSLYIYIQLGMVVCRVPLLGHCDQIFMVYCTSKENLDWPITFVLLNAGSSNLACKYDLGWWCVIYHY